MSGNPVEVRTVHLYQGPPHSVACGPRKGKGAGHRSFERREGERKGEGRGEGGSGSDDGWVGGWVGRGSYVPRGRWDPTR